MDAPVRIVDLENDRHAWRPSLIFKIIRQVYLALKGPVLES